jgi:hypothetical protein
MALSSSRTSNPRRARAIDHQRGRFDVAPRQLDCIDQPGSGDDGRAMLVVMKDRNVHLFAQALFDDEAVRRLDVFQIDAAKGGARAAAPH